MILEGRNSEKATKRTIQQEGVWGAAGKAQQLDTLLPRRIADSPNFAHCHSYDFVGSRNLGVQGKMSFIGICRTR